VRLPFLYLLPWLLSVNYKRTLYITYYTHSLSYCIVFFSLFRARSLYLQQTHSVINQRTIISCPFFSLSNIHYFTYHGSLLISYKGTYGTTLHPIVPHHSPLICTTSGGGGGRGTRAPTGQALLVLVKLMPLNYIFPYYLYKPLPNVTYCTYFSYTPTAFYTHVKDLFGAEMGGVQLTPGSGGGSASAAAASGYG
jgi:hypothetical protein